MFPHIKIFLTQTRRGIKRLMLQFILLCAVTAFFVVSVNLYANSMNNLQTVADTYTTIATAEFYGYVNEMGELVHPGDESCVGRHWLSVEDYDLSPLLALDSVKRIDLRTRVAAYIPGHMPVHFTGETLPAYPSDYLTFFNQNDVIRFVLDTEDPVTYSLRGGWKYDPFPIRILEQSNPMLAYPDQYSLGISMLVEKEIPQYADQIRRLNRSDVTDSITLYPGVEYVLSTRISGDYWSRDPETGKYIWKEDASYLDASGKSSYYAGIGLNLQNFLFFESERLCYNRNSGLTSQRTPHPTKGFFALQRYEDVKADPDWTEYIQAGEYSGSSFTAVMTNDISLVPAWYQGAMYLHEGRMITDAEYKTGANVCMVSVKMAARQGWQVGDKLDMHLYTSNRFHDDTENLMTGEHEIVSPYYAYDCGGFFEEETYEIVGIFGQREFDDFGDTAEEVFFNPWNAIYIPANAASDAPEGPIQPSLITFELQNGSINRFKKTVEEMGLTDFQVGEYEIKFSCFDQGYDKIQPGLDEMHKNAKLLLGLSAVLLLVTMVLLAFLFSRQHKHSAGILRMLGGSKKQAFSAILVCAAAVVAAGGIVGTALGGVLTQSVGTSILGDTAVSAQVVLHTGANPVLTALSGLGCMVLFLTLTAIFTATYIGKEPRELLPQDKG